ncbi:hypothetical protein [Granulosicoccus antarcticus]|uniref:Lipocalin-like domain-containing protein n=1 Tax=Granulosicoccus antarcticus IMCC3135 TaxID=1192854 RepID=A0A2Z2NXR5_9GAMM|nr:hypothetical protein [Granulosicoccus antarcticus]ASJ73610.1 hypothetical protein IMCC3135_17655 [Granulosicoccus antarcticus IMCC3135]
MNKFMKKRSLSIVGSIVLCSLALTACSDNDDDNESQPVADNTQPGLSAADLTGSWSTGCILDDVNDATDGYEIESVSFSDAGFTASAASFSDAGCTTAVVDDDDVDLQGTFSMGDTVLTASGLSATQIDFSYTDAVSGQERILLDLIAIQDGSLFLGEGDFDDLLENDLEARPVSLDLLEPYFAQP